MCAQEFARVVDGENGRDHAAVRFVFSDEVLASGQGQVGFPHGASEDRRLELRDTG
jgi:hypothetical protein